MQGDPGKVTSEERFRGGARNAFKRLWWRAHLFRDEQLPEVHSWGLLRSLGEEESVQFMERPTLAGHVCLLKVSIRRYLDFIKANDKINKQELLRDFQKRIRRLTPLIEFEALTPKETTVLVDEQLAKASRKVGNKTPITREGKLPERQKKNRKVKSVR